MVRQRISIRRWLKCVTGTILALSTTSHSWAGNVSPSISDVNGNIGIGTNSPNAELQVADFLGDNSVLIGAGPANASRLIFNRAPGTQMTGGLQYGHDSDYLRFVVNGAAVMQIQASGNVGIGTVTPAARLHVAGDAQVDGNLAAKYQDVAEWVKCEGVLPAATVVIVNPRELNSVTISDKAYDTRVAGVVSLKPGLLLGEGSEDKTKVAHSGRVKVKVDARYGAIAVGDLLVTSPTPGHAMRSEPMEVGATKLHRPGTLIGKALEPLKLGQWEILVLLTLQ